MENLEMQTIGIIGLGLIGGSLAKALRAKCGVKKIIAYNRTEAPLIAAKDEGVIDAYTTEIDSAFSECGLIFLCTTVKTQGEIVDRLLPVMHRDCVLTDVGSTKKSIVEKMSAYESVQFIGGHPMTGSEKTGYAASVQHLFENAYYILTPAPQATPENLRGLVDIVERLGAIPLIMEPEHHDRVVAAISHVPHVIASMLVNAVNALDGEAHYMHRLAAGGFKDITRIASSSPAMWNEICIDNRSEILNIMEYLKNEIERVEQLIDRDNGMYGFFESAKCYRDSFSQRNAASYHRVYEISMDVEDKPGIIATIATLLCVNGINIKNIGIVNSREYEGGVLRIELDGEDSMLEGRRILKQYNFTIYE